MADWTKVPLCTLLLTICTPFVILILCVGDARGNLSCWKCGQYNDGVGSITPCINSTAQMHLKECPPSAAWCIKYVSEGSTVRDCVETCTEKEAWSTRTYCCQEDGCNGGLTVHDGLTLTLWMTAIAAIIFTRG